MKYHLTHEELVEHLRDQAAFMTASARSFDQGAEGEAKRLATVLRVLLHDTDRSQSVLGLLGVKDKLRFSDTAADINPRNLLSTAGLVMVGLSTTDGSYVAPLDHLSPGRKKPPKPFDPWWTTPVTKDSHGSLFSRRDYVQTVSNKEGGAHVDRSLDQAYVDLTKNNALGWVYSTNSEVDQPLSGNVALVSVRQVAHEVETTIEEQLSDLLAKR